MISSRDLYSWSSKAVVDEDQHILTLLVAEILGNGQTGKSNTSTSAWGLVHLSVHQGDLGGLVLEGDDTTLNHLVVQIVALLGPLADTSEHRETTVSLGNIVDIIKFHDKDSLADSSATKKTNLASLTAGGEQDQVDDLDTSDKDFMLDGHLVKVGSLSVDGQALVGGDGAPLVNCVTDHVDDAANGLRQHQQQRQLGPLVPQQWGTQRTGALQRMGLGYVQCAT